ncbi:MAG: hypothetical protein WAV38_12255 [Xanthobacteraceae bacterium]
MFFSLNLRVSRCLTLAEWHSRVARDSRRKPFVPDDGIQASEAIWQDLWRTTVTYGRAGIAVMAMSVLDIALWDVLGKAAKLPLHRLWGHYRAQLPIYGSGCFRGSGGDGMIAPRCG